VRRSFTGPSGDHRARRRIAPDKTRRTTMKNPLDSLWGTVISGLILTAVLYLIVKNILS
jgi:hypothetical protein